MGYSKTNLAFSVASMLLMYDLLAVSNGYLHHIRLHETFNLGDLSITSNLIDFLAKMGILLALLGFAFSTILALSSVSSEFNTPNSFKRLVQEQFKEFCWFTLVFVPLFCCWVRFYYQGPSDLDKAIAYGAIFLTIQVAFLGGAPVAWLADFPQVLILPKVLALLCSIVLTIENFGINVIDRLN